MTRFFTELRELYEAAGRPDYATLVRQGRAQRPPVTLKDATLSDWLGGKSVPADRNAVAFLVQFLEGRTRNRPRHGAHYWEQLRAQAQRDRRPPRSRRAPAGAAEPVYLQQVRRIAPERLAARETELAELAAFCTRPDGHPYLWWRAPAWAGKSALLSWFVLHPPPGVRIVSFFITARLGGQGDRTAFVEAVLEQLAELLGEPVPPHLTTTNREAHLLRLLHRACPLVLVVDGLDEDLGWTTAEGAHSIAHLLPASPAAGLRVIVAGRPDPPLPADVPLDHPLRDPAALRELAPSDHAQVVRHDAHRDLRRLLHGTPLQQDLLGLVTASGGGLSAADLAELTGRGRLEVADELASVAGRAFQSQAGPVYLFAHAELTESALDYLGPARLEVFRARLHAWADGYAARAWPSSTPGYLLRPYTSLLHTLGDVPRMVALATDPDRHDRLLAVTGSDAAALAEIAAVPPVGLSTTARLAVHREHLRRRNANLPVELVEVRARLGPRTRAEALARVMTGSRQQRALRVVAQVAAEAGDRDDALRLAEEITDEGERVHALLAIATADPARATELLDRAITGASLITDAGRRTRALGQVASAAGQLGEAETYAAARDLAESAARSIPNPALRASALSAHLDDRISAGDIAGADQLWDAMPDGHNRVFHLCALATASASPEDRRVLLGRARDAAAARTDPAQRVIALSLTASHAFAAGLPELADAVTGQALEATHRLESPDERAWALASVTRVAPDRLRTARTLAEDLARSVQDPHRRSVALRHVAVATAESDLERAESLAQEIPVLDDADEAWEEISLVAVRRGDFASARRLAHAVEQPQRRTRVLAGLAVSLADADEPMAAGALADEVENTARLIVARDQLAGSFIALATAMCRARELDRAAALIARAEPLVDGEQFELTVALAAAMIHAGRCAAAEQLARSAGTADPVVIEVARELLRAGEFDRAAALARSFSDDGWRVQAFAALADDLIGAGDLDRARMITGEASACLAAVPSRAPRQGDIPSVLAQLSRDFAGRPRLAQTLARLGDGAQAERIVATLGPASALARTATTVAVALAGAGDTARAVRLLTMAEEAAGAVPIPREIVTLLSDLAPAAVAVGRSDRVASLLDRAEAAVAETSDVLRHQLLAVVAVNAARSGDVERAERLAHTTVRPVWDSHVRRIGEVAEAMAASGHLHPAERLLAIIDTERRSAIQARLVTALLRRGEIDEALRLTRTIADADLAAQALAAVAAVDDTPRAVELVGEALRTGDWTASAATLAAVDPAAAVSLADEFTLLQKR